MNIPAHLAKIESPAMKSPELSFGIAYEASGRCNLTVGVRDALLLTTGGEPTPPPKTARAFTNQVAHIIKKGQLKNSSQPRTASDCFSTGLYFIEQNRPASKTNPVIVQTTIDMVALNEKQDSKNPRDYLSASIVGGSIACEKNIPVKSYPGENFPYTNPQQPHLLPYVLFMKECDTSDTMRMLLSQVSNTTKIRKNTPGDRFVFNAVRIMQAGLVEQSSRQGLALVTWTRPYWGNKKDSIIGVSTLRTADQASNENNNYLTTICPMNSVTSPIKYLNGCQCSLFAQTGRAMLTTHQVCAALLQFEKQGMLGPHDRIDPEVRDYAMRHDLY